MVFQNGRVKVWAKRFWKKKNYNSGGKIQVYFSWVDKVKINALIFAKD